MIQVRADRVALLAAVSAVALLTGGSALAQQGQQAQRGVMLEEIVVTARKVEESIQRIPVAVSALNADQIARLGVQGLRDVAKFTPAFSFENLTGPVSLPVIRGVSQNRVDLPVQNVATFFNGVYLQRAYMVDASLLEIERLEIVKGPQTALYGRNAFAGAINFVTRKPTDDYQLKVEGTVGNKKRYGAKASVSGPIIEGKLRGLLAAGFDKFDGSWKNNHPLANADGANTKGRVGGYDKKSLLVSLNAQPIEAIEIDFSYSLSDLDNEGPANYQMGATGIFSSFNGLNCSPRTFPGSPLQNRLWCGEIPVFPVIQPGETRPPGIVVDPRVFSQRGESEIISAKINYEIIEGLNIAYLFGRTSTDVQSRGSSPRDPTRGVQPPQAAAFVPLIGLTNFDSQPNGALSSWSHEFRVDYQQADSFLSRVLVGASQSRAFDDFRLIGEFVRPVSLEEPIIRTTVNNQSRKDKVTGVFGLVQVKPIDRLTAQAEVRYTKEDLDFFGRQVTPGSTFVIGSVNPPDSNAPVTFGVNRKVDYVTPRFTVDYAITDENLAYATVGKGVRSGGFNIPGLDPDQDLYLPETNWTYEIGVKNTFLDGRLRANAALFYIDWKDLQVTVARNFPNSGRRFGIDCFVGAGNGQCLPPLPGVPPTTAVGNQGSAKVKGIELDGAFALTEAFTINYAASYQSSKYGPGLARRFAENEYCDGVVCPLTIRDANARAINVPDLDGNQVERQPAWKLALGGQYDLALAAWDSELSFRADVTYQSKQYVDEMNIGWTPARTLVDGSITFTRGWFQAKLWGKNIFDEKYATASLFIATGRGTIAYLPFPGERRTFGLTLSAKL